MVTKIFRSSAIDTGLGSWLQAVAPFLVTWDRPYMRNVQLLLHLDAIFSCQSIKELSLCYFDMKGLLARAYCEMAWVL